MNSEPLGVLADIVAAIAVMFIVPILCCMFMKDLIITSYTEKITSSFAETISSHGCIDAEVYKAYLTRLSSVGAPRNIQLQVRSKKYVPVYEGDIFTGEIYEYEECFYTQEIIKKLDNVGKFELCRGDYLHIELTDSDGFYVSVSKSVAGTERGER